MQIEYDEVMCMLKRIQIVLRNKEIDDERARKLALEDIVSMINEIYDAYNRERFGIKEQSK
jgi:hypothetical protein